MELLPSQPPPPSEPDGPDVLRVIDFNGRADPNTDPGLDLDLVQRIYESMVRTRLIDERLTRLQRQGRIGFHVGSEGEEAAILASAAALRPQDWIFPCYREWGAALYRGMPLQTYVDNMFGNANDVARGRQMPDHISGREAHFVSVTAPIGTQITQGVGFAMASKLKREDAVSAIYFGDGATSSNDFHSGMNFAGVYKAPAVFLLRNNGWAISVPTELQTASETFAAKGIAYGIPALRCDGNDALAVYATTQKAVARAANGDGPTLVELLTYRKGPHTTSDDPKAYRDPKEEEAGALRDPIQRLRRYLERQGVLDDAGQAAIEAKLAEELKQAVERAEQTPPPSLESMFEQVYEHMPEHLREQQLECVHGPRARKQH